MAQQMQETLLEKVGATKWIALREMLGAPLPMVHIEAMAEAATESHSISKCVMMLRCPTHKAKWQEHTPAYRRAHRKNHPLPESRKAPTGGAVEVGDL